jgi:hypothetical protein
MQSVTDELDVLQLWFVLEILKVSPSRGTYRIKTTNGLIHVILCINININKCGSNAADYTWQNPFSLVAPWNASPICQLSFADTTLRAKLSYMMPRFCTIFLQILLNRMKHILTYKLRLTHKESKNVEYYNYTQRKN